MRKWVLFGLVICNCVVFTVGNGTLLMLPIYAKALGASSTVEGLYLSFAYLCVAVGTVVGGRLSDGLKSRRRLLAFEGALIVLFQMLMGLSRNLWQLIASTGLTWLVAGFVLATVGTIAGREAGSSERGRVFGIIGISVGVGSLVGGIAVGPMVDAWGYSTMFFALSGLGVLIILSALLAIRETQELPESKESAASPSVGVIGIPLLFLLAGQLLGWVANGPGNMTRADLMNNMEFNKTAITMTLAVGGLLSLPLPLFLGWLSDRVGRRKVIFASYLAGTACLLVLSVAQRFWHFCIAAAMLSLLTVSMSVGPALVADIVRREKVGTAVSLFQSMQWIGTILGFAYSGFASQYLGTRPALLMGSIAGVIAAVAALTARHAQSPASNI